MRANDEVWLARMFVYEEVGETAAKRLDNRQAATVV
jgi:hypothetical protein